MARSPAAAARLEAVAAANRLHADLDLRRRVTQGQGFIDIFEAIGDLDIPLVFKPLDSALGHCLPAPPPRYHDYNQARAAHSTLHCRP